MFGSFFKTEPRRRKPTYLNRLMLPFNQHKHVYHDVLFAAGCLQQTEYYDTKVNNAYDSEKFIHTQAGRMNFFAASFTNETPERKDVKIEMSIVVDGLEVFRHFLNVAHHERAGQLGYVFIGTATRFPSLDNDQSGFGKNVVIVGFQPVDFDESFAVRIKCSDTITAEFSHNSEVHHYG